MATFTQSFKDPMAAELTGYDPTDPSLFDLLLYDGAFPLGDIMRDPRLAEQLLRNDGEAMRSVEYAAWPALPIREPPSPQQPFAPLQLRPVEPSDSTTLLGARRTVHSTAINTDEWPASISQRTQLVETSEDSTGSTASSTHTPASSCQDASSPNNRDSMDAEGEILSRASPASSGHTGMSDASRPGYLPRALGTGSFAPMNQQAARVSNISGATHITSTAPNTVSFPRIITNPHWDHRPHLAGTFMDGHYRDDHYDPNDDFYSEFQAYADLTTTDYTVNLPVQAAGAYALEQHTFVTPVQAHRFPSSWPYHPGNQPQYLTVSPQARQTALPAQSQVHGWEVIPGIEPAQRTSAPLLSPVADISQRSIASSGTDTTVRPAVNSRQELPAQSQQPAQSSRKAARGRVSPPAATRQFKRKKDESYSPESSSSHRSTILIKKSARTLAKAEPSSAQSRSPVDSSQKTRKGGRRHQLSETARQRTAEMRDSGACWKCRMQRDPCDDKTPCSRCVGRAQRVSAQVVECHHDNLPEFKSQFLPDSMSYMHEEQSIRTTMRGEVWNWRYDNPIDIEFTNGYGPPLRWRVYEFIPKTQELLTQLQYFQDPTTRMSRAYKKYSPPFALLKLDSDDKEHVDLYLDQLMTEDYLEDLGRACFEEENAVDPSAFQCRLLSSMCKLFTDTQDDKLKDLLGSVIRIMIITYIMGHTLTINDNTLESVLSNIKHSPLPNEIKRRTSPRLANRQLKFFFAALRLDIFNVILRWLQRTFQSSGSKEASWLKTFCAMLGLAMVLEEIQRTLQIQADAKIQKEEMSPAEAIEEACAACRAIDDRFSLLERLFRWKYPRKKVSEEGSFGPGTPELAGEAEHQFLAQLRMMVEDNANHLESRRSVKCRHENQCQFTSRLVAKFLLPFLSESS